MSSADFQRLAAAAARRYRDAGRFAMGFARGKLTGDPVFEHLLASGAARDARRVLDLGCGQGLLAALLHSAQQAHRHGDWPSSWPAPPQDCRVHGIELMPRDVARAQAALGTHADFVLGDIADTPFPDCDLVVILDVLHYLPYDRQQQVLTRVARSLAPTGRLLLRIGDASAGLGFAISQWVDRVVTFSRGHRLGQLYCRPLPEWTALLNDLGFEVDVQAMSEGTLFANVLLTADLRAQART